jgi:hypothetical protein
MKRTKLVYVLGRNEKEGLDVYMWGVTYDTNEKKIIREEIWLQFSNKEAVKWKNEHIGSADA